MIYLLGGPPKVGKSLISKTMTSKHGINVVSTDSLGAVLENVLDPEREPGLFVVNTFNAMTEEDKINVMREKTMTRIHDQIEESLAVWKAVEPFILREQDEGRDVVVEGVAVLPKFVKRLEHVDYRALFIGNQGNEHKENIKKGAKENEHDWMRGVSDEFINAFATFVVQMSCYIENEANKYGFTYIEMNGKVFSDAVGEVVDSLLV